jgi:hypothetical protein
MRVTCWRYGITGECAFGFEYAISGTAQGCLNVPTGEGSKHFDLGHGWRGYACIFVLPLLGLK